MVLRDTVFLFFPSIVKNFSFFSIKEKEKKTEFITINPIKKRKINEKEFENKNYLIFADTVWKQIKKKLNSIRDKEAKKNNDKEGKKLNKVVLIIEYPDYFQKIKNFLYQDELIGNSKKHFIFVNIASFDLIKNLQEQYLICPLCDCLHEQKNDTFICRTKNVTLNKKVVIDFNQNNIESYLKNIQKTINELLDEIKIEKKIKIDIETMNDVFNGELYKKVLTIIEEI